ncbi:MAG: hypothetical protein NVS2B15_01630 [Pseudarthrobacter sp.]
MNWHPPVPSQVTDARGATWLVRRAWPDRLAGEYVLEVCDPARPGVLAAHLRRGNFDPVPISDPLMPSLAQEAPKGEIVVHRAHKRAVIHAGGQYIKVFRPGRALDAANLHTLAAAPADGGSFTVPRIIAAGTDVIVFSSISGRSYYELGQDHATVTDESFTDIWTQWSRAWATFVSVSNSPRFRTSLDQLPEHPPETEAANLWRWINHWLRHSEGIPEAAPGRAALLEQAEATLNMLTDTPRDPLGWAHGDLHDKQILGSSASRPGLLDFDGTCRAEAALDLANLDVHLELRLRQHLLTSRRYVIAHRSILATARKLHVSPDRFAAYAACTRLRLACLYSFRPPWGADASQYLNHAGKADTTDFQEGIPGGTSPGLPPWNRHPDRPSSPQL